MLKTDAYKAGFWAGRRVGEGSFMLMVTFILKSVVACVTGLIPMRVAFPEGDHEDSRVGCQDGES